MDSKKKCVKRKKKSDIESTADEINKSGQQLTDEEKTKNIKIKTIEKLGQLMKKDKQLKDMSLPEKYKQFLINYSDSLKLGKYTFYGFDPMKDITSYKTEDMESMARKLLKKGHPNRIECWLEADNEEFAEEDDETTTGNISFDIYSSFMPWIIAEGESDEGSVYYFIDLKSSTTGSDADIPVYKLEVIGGNWYAEESIQITIDSSDINDFLTVARLLTKPLQQKRKIIEELKQRKKCKTEKPSKKKK